MNLTSKVKIDTLRESDRDQWEALYRGYMAFYNRNEPQSLYDQAWTRLLADDVVHARVARDADESLVGLVHFTPHASMSGDICYLQDLFTAPTCRGRGVGTQLIQAVVTWSKARGDISKVYWNTHASNPARKLYDAVGNHKGFVKYQIDVLHHPTSPSLRIYTPDDIREEAQRRRECVAFNRAAAAATLALALVALAVGVSRRSRLSR